MKSAVWKSRLPASIFFDLYKMNHGTGSFILIDPLTNRTAAAGLIRGVVRSLDEMLKPDTKEPETFKKSPHTVWSGMNIPREVRENPLGPEGGGALVYRIFRCRGKSTIAKRLEQRLFDAGHHTILLDGGQHAPWPVRGLGLFRNGQGGEHPPCR